MTEDKIKEAFEAWWADFGQKMIPDKMEYGLAMIVKESCFVANRAGYLALLNSLEKCGTINSTGHPKHLSHIYGTYELQLYGNPAPVFRLPEGVTKP